MRDLDIIVLSETWLNESVFSEELIDGRYTIYRKDRNFELVNKKDGGGCLIAVKSCYVSTRLSEWETDKSDIWISLKQESGSNIFFNGRYIDYGSNLNDYNVHFNKINEIIKYVRAEW